MLSWWFGALLLAVVALYYLAPRRPRCPGCGARRDPESPLCTACGWIHDDPDDADDDDAEGEPEEVADDVIDEPWRGN